MCLSVFSITREQCKWNRGALYILLLNDTDTPALWPFVPESPNGHTPRVITEQMCMCWPGSHVCLCVCAPAHINTCGQLFFKIHACLLCTDLRCLHFRCEYIWSCLHKWRYNTVQKFEIGEKWKSLLCSLHLFDKKYSNNVKYYYHST